MLWQGRRIKNYQVSPLEADVPVVKSQAATFSISSSAKIGDSAQFLCNATTTVPQCYAHFMHNDKKIATAIVPGFAVQSSPNTSVNGSGNQYYYKYTISSLTCSDRGNYRCYVANNNAAALKSNSETLDVLGPAGTPNLTAPSDNQILNDNVTVSCENPVDAIRLIPDVTEWTLVRGTKTFDCVALGNPDPSTMWEFFPETPQNSRISWGRTMELDPDRNDPQTKPMPSTITEDPSTRKPNPSATTKKTVAIAASITDVPVVKSQAATFSISSSAKIGDSAQFFCNATTTVPQYYAHFMHNDNITATAIVPGFAVQSSPNTSVNGSGNHYCYKYTISSLSCSDRGNYRCYVLNKNGNVLESNSETLDVLDDPQTKPMPSTITEDPSTRKPNPSATTKKTVAIAASITETVNIMIKSVIGTLIILIIVIVFSIILYKYRATRAKIQRTRKLQKSVPVVKSQTVTFSISSSAKIGDSAQFFCNATTTVIQYDANFMHNDIWIAVAIVPGVSGQSDPNTSVTGSATESYYKYTISSLSCSDRGNYRCEVVKEVGYVLKSNSETLDVLGPAGTPDLTAPSDNQILNDNVTVSCESNVGSPAQELHLCVGNTCAKPNPAVKQVDQCIFTQTASLTFQVTKTTKTATCRVGSSSLEDKQTWEVDYPVDAISLIPNVTDRTLVRGTKGTFDCVALGNPDPSTMWEFFPETSQTSRISWGRTMELDPDTSGV
ncbi:carcinoembryonic antigen-related cell adhesion molecule 5-like [Octopus vulgaris]|uniref:Carcinoembryonic antigen-related cell adhesion molecule 5-like n=1 Tax=Octopus vulgaris TaxID=6645 RepID=A0AA36FGX1_OCTVU|nr:carcinoembryonic antigen-related cell adhesion molecule 5-like [Octopus vulgaris]